MRSQLCWHPKVITYDHLQHFGKTISIIKRINIEKLEGLGQKPKIQVGGPTTFASFKILLEILRRIKPR